MPKSIFASRTFWFNVLSGLSLFFLLPELQTLLGPNTLKYILLANAGVNIILRYVTEDPIRPISQTFAAPLVLVLLATQLAGCGLTAQKAPVLVAKAGLGVAQSIGAISDTVKQLNQAAGLPAAAALKIQEGLLTVNTKLAPLPGILRAIDAAQTAGTGPGTNVDKAIGILEAVSGDVATLLAGVPVNETTKALIDLVRAAQTTTTTVLVEIAKLKAR